MADRYWVGGTGNWSDTNRWSTASGGAGGASVPTSADNVIFDAASNVGTGTFTVTVDGTSGSPSKCLDFSTGGAGGALDGAMTLAFGTTTPILEVWGNFTLPATNFSTSGGTNTSVGQLIFRGNGTNTITTNGVSITPPTSIGATGDTGTWTLGSAYSSGNNFFVNAGTFNTSASNYSLSVNLINSNNTNTRTITLNASSVTLTTTGTPLNFSTTTGLTFNAGTSTITCSTTSPTFSGGGLTFYNVSFTSAASGTTTINGANTFNNLTQTSRSATGTRLFAIAANQTVSGTLTLGAANTAIRRILLSSDSPGTRRTITLNGSLATLSDCDFRDIGAAGTAGTWTGTRLGDGGNNSGITFDAPKTVYWNLAGTQNWSATGWATTNNGTPAVNNFPLAQDTATFTEAGAAGTVTFDTAWYVGSIQMADGVSNRTTAFTLATGANSPIIFGNITLFSNLTLTGTGTLNFRGQGVTQTITSAGITFPQAFNLNIPNSTFKIADAFTQTSTTGFTHTAGTVDLNNLTLTCYLWSSSNSNTRSIAFGTGNITVTGNNGSVLSMSTATNFTYTGTSNLTFNYSGSTGTRTITPPSTDATASNSLNINVTAGTDTVTVGGSARFLNFNLTGFSGTLTYASTSRYFGNLTFSSGMTLGSIAGSMTFAAASGTQTITSNGKTIEAAATVDAPGATVQLQDNLTLGSTRTFTLTAGTLDLSSGNRTLSTGLFSSNNSNTRAISFGTGGTITVTGSGSTAFNTGTNTNLTVSGTGTISMTSSSAKTFAGGGFRFTGITLNQGGAGDLTITGSNKFGSLKNSTQPAKLIFTAGTTTKISNFELNGTSGNLISLESTAPGTKYTIMYES